MAPITTWQVVTTNVNPAVAGNGYVFNSGAFLSATCPTAINVGDTIAFTVSNGGGATGFTVRPGAGTTIVGSGIQTAFPSGGVSVTSNGSLVIIGISSTRWRVFSSTGIVMFS